MGPHRAGAALAVAMMLAGAGAGAAESRWFELKFHGQKVGHLEAYDEPAKVDGEPAIHAHRVSIIVVKRLEDTIRMEHTVDAWFRPDGQPLRYRVRRVEGGEVRIGRGDRVGDAFVIEHTIGGDTRKRQVQLKPTDRLASSLEWLHLRKPEAGARIEGRVIEETEGDVQDFVLTVGEPSGGRFPATETMGGMKSLLQVVPGVGVVRSELEGAGIVSEQVERATAERVGKAVDIFRAAMFEVKADLPPRDDIDGLVLRFRREGGKPPTVGDFAGQKVARTEASVQVQTSRPSPPSSKAKFPETTPELAPYLASTDYENLEDPQLVATAKRVVGDAKDPWTAARRLNRFVNRHLRDKTLAHAYASASEALSSRSGDCTEHAVLFSALAKISGIPTRLATGLVYVGGAKPAFGYHEWAEIHVGGRWHPVDPTFGQDTADATHVKFSEGSSDPEGLRQAGLAAASLIGDVHIELEAAIVNGKRVPLR